MWKTIKDIMLVSVFVIALKLLGDGINYFIDKYNLFGWLTDFFSILKFFTKAIDFMWDTSTMWAAITIVLGIEVVHWGYIATMGLIKWFK